MNDQSATTAAPLPRKGEIVELTIEDWGDRGRGIAHLGRMVVLTDRGLPGDRITARITKRRSHHLEASLQSIVEPSPSRITPRCAHFGACGGCKLQDLEYSHQAADKARHVREQLRRIGGLDNIPDIELIALESPWHYRNKMEFSFGGHREGRVLLGLHSQDDYRDSFDLQECWITDPRAAEIVAATRAFCVARNLPSYDPVAHIGFLRFLVVRFGAQTDEVLVNLVTADRAWDDADDFGVHLRSACPYVTTSLWTATSSRANVATGETKRVFFGPGVLHDRIGPFTFEIAPTGFFQTNTRGAELLFAKVIEWIGAGHGRVLDLYSGAGAISLLLSQAAEEVIGVESHAESVAAAERNAARNHITNCRFICADTLDHLRAMPADEISGSTVVLDPPRVGLHPKVIRILAETLPARIVCVSCNPAALARDLQMLGDAYRLVKLAAVDMFPHTPHVEAVALLERS